MAQVRWVRTAMLVALVLATVGIVPVAAQPSTPDGSDASDPFALFGLMPADLPVDEDSGEPMIMWADIAGQLAAMGASAPASMDDPAFDTWIDATMALAVPPDPAQFLQFWREDYGFDLLQADQTLTYQAPPAQVTILRGRFDPGEIVQALRALGYQQETVDGHDMLAVRDDFEIDFEVQTAYRLAGMNVVAMPDPATVVFSSARAPVAAVLDVAAGQAPSMLEVAGPAALLGHAPANLVSATLVAGTSLAASPADALLDTIGAAGTPDLDAVATEIAADIAAAGEMPPVVAALLGSTAGTDDPHAVAVLLMLSPEMAETAAGVIERRLATEASAATGELWSEMFTGWDVAARAGIPAVVVDLSLGETPANILTQLLFRRDLGFAAW